MDNFTGFIKRNKWKIILAALGLLIAILLLTIGFWATLLVFIVVGACFFIGMLLDEGGRERVGQFFSTLFRKN